MGGMNHYCEVGAAYEGEPAVNYSVANNFNAVLASSSTDYV